MSTSVKLVVLIGMCMLALHCAVGHESRLDDKSPHNSSGSQTTGAGGYPNFTIETNETPDDGNFGGAGTCYSDEVKPENLKINIVLLLDRSASMSGYTWNVAILQLEKFIKDTDSSGINIALSYFPAIPDDTVCDKKLYEAPTIPFGTLPGNASNLITSLKNVMPTGSGTPLLGGMIGTYNWLVPYASSTPGEQTILLVVSDGDPNTCSSSYGQKQELHDIAASALVDGVKTGAIALAGANLSILDTIAKGGGTKEAIDITYDTNELQESLNQISNSFQCEYTFDNQAEFDPEKWFIKYKSSNGFPDWVIPRVLNMSECDQNHGWYYDNNTNPNKVILCAQACELITFDKDFTLQFAFGCKEDHGPIN